MKTLPVCKSILCILNLCLFLFLSSNNCRAQDSTAGTPPFESSTFKKDTVPGLDVITTIPAVKERKIPDTLLRKIKNEEVYWYADKAPERKKEKDPENNSTGSFLDQKLWSLLIWIILIIGVIALVGWYLASGNIRLFRKKPADIVSDNDTIEEEDIFNLNYDDQVKNALSVKDYRLAVRLMYLSVLKDLADNNIIIYKQGKTNREYLAEVNKSEYYRSFSSLTRIFEYTWYGKFNLSGPDFVLIQTNFQTFKKLFQ
ncbi:MAG TPA: hypothetical protein VGO09_02390 [Flavisolibacter sp.]|nr:hypothetical protein [Flavisolibacter sp.]